MPTAVKRREDAHLGQSRLRQLQLRLGHLRIGCRRVLSARADELAACQIFAAFEVRQREVILGFHLRDFGFVQRVIERDQKLPLRASLKADGRDAARHFGSQDHAFIRLQRADRLQVLLHGGGLDLDHFDRSGRRRGAFRGARTDWRGLRCIRRWYGLPTRSARAITDPPQNRREQRRPPTLQPPRQ